MSQVQPGSAAYPEDMCHRVLAFQGSNHLETGATALLLRLLETEDGKAGDEAGLEVITVGQSAICLVLPITCSLKEHVTAPPGPCVPFKPCDLGQASLSLRLFIPKMK